MRITYKIDVLAALKDAGYTTYKLRKEKIIGERTIQQLRNHEPVSWEVVSRLCDLLNCDVGDLLHAERDAATASGAVPASPSGDPASTTPGRGMLEDFDRR